MLLVCSFAQLAHGALGELQPLPNHNILRLAPIPEPSNPDVPAVPGQFGSVSVSSGGATATATGLSLSASFGRVFSSNAPDFLFGDPVLPPAIDANGDPLVGQTPTQYWRAEPMRSGEQVKIADINQIPVAADEKERFHYSPHSGNAFASHEGRIRIVWRTRLPVDEVTNSFAILDQQYNVSASSRLPVRKMFWTEGRYTGPTVSVPEGIVQDLEIVYNSALPATVPEEEAVLQPAVDGAPVLDDTLWFDETQSVLRAINREGRVLIEYLGAANGAPGSGLREHLGLEVVDLVQETLPVEVETLLGERILPKPDGETVDLNETSLVPMQVNAVSLGIRYTERHTLEGRDVYYAIRENDEPLRVQFYWLEKGIKDILWPSYLNSYRLSWPESLDDFPAKFARPANADESDETFVALPRANTPELVFQDDSDGSEASLDFQSRFLVDLSGGDDAINRSLLRFSSGNDFWYVRVYSSPEALLGDQDRSDTIDRQQTALVGDRLEPPAVSDSVAGYIDTNYGTAYNTGAYIDPFSDGGLENAERGSIIPVNALPGNDRLRVWWFEEIAPPTGLAEVFEPIFFPSTIVEYTLSYPGNARQIVLASNEGSGDLSSEQSNGSIYVQNDPNSRGYNPNEEHALMISGRAYALRDDLNVPDVSSEPFILLDYEGNDGRPSMAVFEVLRETADIVFEYPATAGTILQAPMPLPILPLPLLDNGQSKNQEVDSGQLDLSANEAASAAYPHYDRFTYEDRKGNKWIYRGPHDLDTVEEGAEPYLSMQFHYKTQPGFAFPDETTGADSAPSIGSIVPYLRLFTNGVDASGGFDGDPISGTPINVDYVPHWPDLVPELRFGETLTLPKFGLPQVRGQRSMQIIYEGSQTNETLPAGEVDTEMGSSSVVLHDPTRQKLYSLASNELDRIPASIATTQSRGKTYFQNLPTHLQNRFYFDPNIGDLGGLVFVGEFVDEVAGEDYLLLNVLSSSELATVKALCDVADERKAEWDAAVEGLSTTVERFIENPNVRGTYIVDPDGDHQTFESEDIAALSRPPARPDVPANGDLGFYDEAVDSFALTAVGGGEGYVVLLAGNGEAFTPEEEPVTIQILRVGGGLYTGELKPIVASNPLSENVTVQHTGDFAAQTPSYEFEWRKAPPVDGLSPAVYEFTHQEIDSSGVSYLVARDATETIEIGLPNNVVINEASVLAGVSLYGQVDIVGASPTGSELALVYLGLRLEDTDSVIARINGVTAIDTEFDIPTANLPSDVESIMGGENAPDLVYAVDSRLFSLEDLEQLEFEYSSTADEGAASELDVRIAATFQVDRSTQNYIFIGREDGKNRHLVSGSGVDTLGDNYFIMRYRPGTGHTLYPENGYPDDATGWSEWTRPALVEGWIKRVLAGINPFNQRISDFYDNAIDTDVSLLTQAGTRWEGDVALNLDSVQDAGLIEIYETVLKRGISLSIGGTPNIDYAPANDALLLAAGYLADLYLALGNEAYADAANPTILFDSQAIGTVADASIVGTFEDEYRSTSTARFAFQGQVSSLLEEELHLLRGRDDFLSPSIEVSPAYNRLFWNYTRGIDAGEVIYALNYNITEKDDDKANGKIDAADAQRQYPQGHGDAYGHYLTALKNYYRLLSDEHFTWGTRSEAVNILGQPVSVDYLDERKFAAAAASLARTTRQIQTLEHRKAHLDVGKDGWSHLDQSRENDRTGRIRNWSFDDWSARGGQSAYYNWIIANAILPEEDSVHEGIQKIDRTTVPELDELASNGASIQRRMDSADRGLNPLDLTPDSLVFDISPQVLVDGKTHFEQIYARAARSLGNAFDVFDRATDSSRLLRSLENQNQNLDSAVVDQERAFVLQLLDIYGAPYPGDVGPGKTYPQGYSGPDLYRYMYIDRPFDIFEKDTLFSYSGGKKTVTLAVKDNSLIESFNTPIEFSEFAEDAEKSSSVTYSIDEDDGPYQFASDSLGKRPQIGTLQDALAGVRLAEEQLYTGLVSMDTARKSFIKQLEEFEKDMANRIAIKVAQEGLDTAKKIYNEVRAAVKAIRDAFKLVEKTSQQIAGSAVESLPVVVGVSSDVSSAARGGILASRIASTAPVTAADVAAAKVEAVADAVFLAAEFAVKFTVLGLEEDTFYRAQAGELKSKYSAARSATRELDALHVAYVRALERYRNELSNGETILAQRETYRKRAAAVVQGYRTRDVAFRSFRTEALEQYQNLFDWAAKYAFLAAQAYDYETGLLGSDSGREFLGGIAGSRALGLLNDAGEPTFAASEQGDPGLSGFLARMKTDWDVVKGRLGFNNPDVYGTTFSLRSELFRLPNDTSGDRQWKELLAQLTISNLLENADIAAHALQVDTADGTPVAGIVIEFPTEIATGLNFFGQPLASGDHRFTESNFATKIHSAGVVFEGYDGMDACHLCSSGAAEHQLADHGPNALSATPHVYLIPVGTDAMRTPPLGDSEVQRQWQVLDHALPLPYDIGSIEAGGGDAEFYTIGSRSLGGGFLAARKHQAFRAVDNEAFFLTNRSDEYTNSRLIGRSAENSKWLLVIPAAELLNDPEEGLRRFIETVSDIKLHFKTYSYSGN